MCDLSWDINSVIWANKNTHDQTKQSESEKELNEDNNNNNNIIQTLLIV